MARVISYIIDESFDGLKIGVLLKFRKGYSTSLIRSIKTIKNGIMLDNQPVRTIDVVHTGNILTVTLPEETSEIEPMECELDIVYEDDDILVINKSPFMAMHPTHNHQGDTLANGVVAHLKNEGKSTVFRAVGRLDKGTSGLVVCALNPLAACKLSGKVEKEYYAVVKGNMEVQGTVDTPVYRPDPMKTLRACSRELGTENAVTHWTLVKQYENKALIRLKLETGRTHQIRVHMASIGHPLAGDTYYGDFEPRHGHQLLHCGKCSLIHPVTDEKMEFIAKLPAEFEK